jgi:hypothetical protein
LEIGDNLVEFGVGHFGEDWTLEGDSSRLVDTTILGNLLGSKNVVTSDHANEDTSVLASADGLGDQVTNRIHDTDNTDENEVVLRGVLQGDFAIEVLVSKSEGTETLGSKSFDSLREIGAHFVGKRLDLAILSQHSCAELEDHLRSTLGIDTVRTIQELLLFIFLTLLGGLLGLLGLLLGFGGGRLGGRLAILTERDDSRHTLTGRGEGIELLDYDGITGLLVVTTELVVENEKSALSFVTNEFHGLTWDVRDSGGGVNGNAFSEKVVDGLGELLLGRNLVKLTTRDPSLDDSHSVLSQGTGLVGANVGSTTHGLASLQVTDKVLVVHHLAHGVGERDCDGKGKTLRDSDDNNGDGNNEVLKDTSKLGPLPRLVGDFVDDPVDSEDDEDENGNTSSDLTDQNGERVKLLLKRCLLRLLLELGESLTPLRVHTNCNNDHTANTISDLASREHEGILLLGLADGIRLTSDTRLIDVKIEARNEETVGRDLTSGAQDDDITSKNIVVVNLLLDLGTNNGDLKVVLLFVKFSELLIFRVVVSGL